MEDNKVLGLQYGIQRSILGGKTLRERRIIEGKYADVDQASNLDEEGTAADED